MKRLLAEAVVLAALSYVLYETTRVLNRIVTMQEEPET